MADRANTVTPLHQLLMALLFATAKWRAARIRTSAENRMTGMTTKHSPKTGLVELVAVSQGVPGEGLLSSPLASLSLLSLSSASR
jgi:hypothetical protein